jgi:cysteinyl-tRNA synthetase
MQTSYRKPLNFSWDALETANAQLKKLYKFASHQTIAGEVSETYKDQFIEALSDDLNTAKAIAVVWEVFNSTDLSDADKWATLLYFDQVLGLKLDTVPKFVITDEAKSLVQKRDEAKASKDFATSDQIRNELIALGYEVVDTPEGTTLQ